MEIPQENKQKVKETRTKESMDAMRKGRESIHGSSERAAKSMQRAVSVTGKKAERKKEKLSTSVVWISLVTTFLSMQFGYNVWIVYSPNVLLQDFYNISTYEELKDPVVQKFMIAVTIALFPIGAIFGTIMFGYFVDKFGRKKTLITTNFLCIVSAVFMGISNTVEPIEFTMFARLYTGVCAGLITTIVPIYLCEISQTSTRGSTVMVNHLSIILGVMTARILGLREILGTGKGWPLLMGLAGILPLSQVLFLPLFPESPRYLLIQKRKEEKAIKALKKLRQREDVEDEIEELYQEALFEKGEKKMDTLKLLLPIYNQQWQVLTVFVLTIGQQLTGTNAAYFYIEKLYLTTKLATDKVRYISIASHASLCLSTLVGVCLVDYVGRRMLILVGFGICSSVCVLISITLKLQETIPIMAYVSTVFDDIFLIAHSFGPNPVTPLLVGELFLQSSRSSAFVILGVFQWIIHLFTGVTFEHVQNLTRSFTFLLYLPLCLGVFLYILQVVPETNNKTFLEIRKRFSSWSAKKTKAKIQVNK